MAESRESLSEQSKRRTAWILSVLGLIVLFLFGALYCSMRREKKEVAPTEEQNRFIVENVVDGGDDFDANMPKFGISNAELLITPREVVLPDVILGSTGEVTLTLRAENGPIVFKQKYLAETPEDGFTFDGPCKDKSQLNKDEECTMKISWTPTTIKTIQNTLTIVWREDSPRVLEDSRTQIQLKGNSTDSKECVCCEEAKEKEKGEKHPRVVMNPDGTTRPLEDGDKIGPGGVLVDENGNPTGEVVEPELIAIGLNNEFLGRISEYRSLIDDNGRTVGRLLGDNTLVDTELNVLGAAVPLVSVLNAQGFVIGELIVNEQGTEAWVRNSDNEKIGTVQVDGSVVDSTGAQIGRLSDWGMTLDLAGNYMGIIFPTGGVINKDKKVVGFIQQNGFVTTEQGSLIGGAVPKGIAVGTGGRSFGAVALDGTVKDSYGQIVGRTMLDGGVIDSNFTQIGSVVRQGLVVNSKAEIVGFVNSEGKGIDSTGSLIGAVAPNGIVKAGKKTIGGVLQVGRVVGTSACGIEGSVYPNGVVMSPTMQEVGRIRADGYMINGRSKVSGSVVPHGTVIAEGCRLVGLISLSGQVTNASGMAMGCINIQKEVVSAEGQKIKDVGITPVGAVISPDGTVVGWTQYDGQIIDKNGKVIDCMRPDGTSNTGVAAGGGAGAGAGGGAGGAGSLDKGVVLDDNGLPTEWTCLAGKCYNERNEEIGTVAFNGWVSDKQGRLIGFIAPTGTIFSPTGTILGTYNSLMGEVLNTNGDPFGRVMPDMTVLNEKGTKILGGLIGQNTSVADQEGTVLGALNYEGQVVDDSGKALGRLTSDGTLYGEDNNLMGGVLSSGAVLSALGAQVGWADGSGNVLVKGTRVASVLPGGLAVTPDNRVMGRVWMPVSVIVGAEGVIGTISQKAMAKDATAYQIAAYDKTGTYMGVVSPFGVLLNNDGRLGGVAVPVTMVMDLNHDLLGWVNFKGNVVNADGQSVGQVATNGVVLNEQGDLIGTLITKGTVVDERGDYIGRVGVDGAVYAASGTTDAYISPGAYVSNDDFSISGRVLPLGLGLTAAGQALGWTRYDGLLANSQVIVGRVGTDNRVVNENGDILGGFVALGAPSVQDDVRMCGIVGETGTVSNVGGRSVGVALAPDYTLSDGKVTGRLHHQSNYVRGTTENGLIGVMNLDGIVYRVNSSRQMGTIGMNGLMSDPNKKITGALLPTGFVIQTNIKPNGKEDWLGDVWLGGKNVAKASGLGYVYENVDVLTGGVFTPEAIIDRNGLPIGRSNSVGAVVDNTGKKIASRMAFYSALTSETIWAGGPIQTGFVIDDYARKIGAVAADGSVMSGNGFKGRILSDGSAAGVPERKVYNSMPYMGHLVVQGIPIGYLTPVLGRSSISGDIIDSSDKPVYQMLDDGFVLGKEMVLDGKVQPLRGGLSHKTADLIGIPNGDGKLVSFSGEDLGKVDVNGAVVPNSEGRELTDLEKLREVAILVPETLVVTNTCSVVGQTFYNGDVVNGLGNTVGRMWPTRLAKDPRGIELGHAVIYGPITGTGNTWVYLGRSLPDSTVVDPDGVSVGCARGDKSVYDSSGNKLGRLRDRGPVISAKTKKMVGRVDAMGRVIGKDGEDMGFIGGDGEDIWYNDQGERMGWMVSGTTDRIVFNPDGTVAYVVGADGWVRGADGQILFRVDQQAGKIYDKDGNLLWDFNNPLPPGGALVFLYDMDTRVVAQLNGCELLKIPGLAKMGTLLANGQIRDENDEVILRAASDGRVYNAKDDTQFGYFSGVGMDLRRCGLSSTGGLAGTGGRVIKWHDGEYILDPDGLLLDKDTLEPVGMLDPGSLRPIIWTEEEPSRAEEQPEPKVKPPLPPIEERPAPPDFTRWTPPDEVVQGLNDIIRKRHKAMRDKMGGRAYTIEAPEAVVAMAQKHDLDDWGTEKNVSTWRVNMSNVILKDKAIPAVLVHSIDTRYPAPVTAIVERHIYAEVGRNIIIPAGSRLIGSLGSSGLDAGRDKAAKVDITWERLVRPDGAAFTFSGVSGDAQGRGGVAAYLDDQLLKKYGKPFLETIGEGLILKLTEINDKGSTSGVSAGAGNSEMSETTGHQIRKRFIENFKQIYDDMMSSLGDIPNVLFVPAGTRLTVYPQEDLWLRTPADDVKELEKGGINIGGGEGPAGQPDPRYHWINERNKDKGDGTENGGDNDDGGGNTPPPEPTPSDPSVEPSPIYTPDDDGGRIVTPVQHERQPSKPDKYF